MLIYAFDGRVYTGGSEIQVESLLRWLLTVRSTTSNTDLNRKIEKASLNLGVAGSSSKDFSMDP